MISANRVFRDHLSNEVSNTPSVLSIKEFNDSNDFIFWFDSDNNVEGSIRRLDISIKDYSNLPVEWHLPVNVLYKLHYHFN